LPDAAEERFWSGVRDAARFFMGTADVQRALEKLARSLDDLGLPYAIIGAMALNEFGYQRTTVDVDVLLTAESLAAFKRAMLGRGYVEKVVGSRSMRDTEHGVDIDVVLTGDYPGDGKPKPVVFPDPKTTAERGARVALLPLARLLELKLASGMTAPHRLRDLADVQELIRVLKLPRTLAETLDTFVREKYLELWHSIQDHADDRR
jgi:hypothetical protein